VKLQLGGMVVVGGPHRADERDVVDPLPDMRPPVAQFQAALAALLETDLQGIQCWHQIARHAGEVPHVVAVEGRIEDGALVGRFVDRLAGVFIQRGLGIETLDMTRPAEHEVPDHALGLGRKQRLLAHAGLSGGSLPAQQGAEGEAGETHAAIGEELSAGWAVGGIGHDRSFTFWAATISCAGGITFVGCGQRQAVVAAR